MNGDRRRRSGVAAYLLLVAISAYAGALGLVTSGLDMRATIDHRLPLHSPVFGGIALALVVGVPTTIAAITAWRGDRCAGDATTAAGVLLVGWIVVELAFIRQLSWLQPAYIAIGASFMLIGRRRVAKRAAESPRSGNNDQRTPEVMDEMMGGAAE